MLDSNEGGAGGSHDVDPEGNQGKQEPLASLAASARRAWGRVAHMNRMTTYPAVAEPPAC